MHAGEINPKQLILNNKILFHVDGHVKVQNNIFFPILIHEMPLPDKVGVWCAMCNT